VIKNAKSTNQINILVSTGALFPIADGALRVLWTLLVRSSSVLTTLCGRRFETTYVCVGTRAEKLKYKCMYTYITQLRALCLFRNKQYSLYIYFLKRSAQYKMVHH
jgi:hypothetical protein